MNVLQNTLRYPDCLVRASPFFDGRLEHDHAGLVLEKLSDCFDVELPEFRDFGWGYSAVRQGPVLRSKSQDR